MKDAEAQLPSVSRPGRRPYRQRIRAEQQAATRRRIAEAAVELHGTVGPARTTVKAVADRAGVERLTVYRHFPDERALFAACSARYLEDNPPPDLAAPMSLPDPAHRLHAVLVALYGYYGRTAGMLAALLRDVESVPLVAAYMGPYVELLDGLSRQLTDGFGTRRDGRTVRAAIGHALEFPTWESLAQRQGLSDADAARLMTTLVRSIVDGPAADVSARRSRRPPPVR